MIDSKLRRKSKKKLYQVREWDSVANRAIVARQSIAIRFRTSNDLWARVWTIPLATWHVYKLFKCDEIEIESKQKALFNLKQKLVTDIHSDRRNTYQSSISPSKAFEYRLHSIWNGDLVDDNKKYIKISDWNY